MKNINICSYDFFLTIEDYEKLINIFDDMLDFNITTTNASILKKIRLTLKMTQQEFAEKLNKKQNTILKYELCSLKVNTKLLKEIIKCFNVPTDVFYSLMQNSKNELDFSSKLCEIIALFKPYILELLSENQNVSTPLDKKRVIEELNFKIEDYNSLEFEIYKKIEKYIFDFIEKYFNNYFDNLFMELYPFESLILKENEELTLSENDIFYKVKQEIEEIENENEKRIKAQKIKEIERNIKKYTKFLLKEDKFL